MLRIPADIWRGCGSELCGESSCQATSPDIRIMNGTQLSGSAEYTTTSVCVRQRETKESFVHFVMKRAGDSELCITPEARGRHVADTCPAQYILFIQCWWPDLSAAWIWENVVNLNKIKILLGPLRMCCTAAMMLYCSVMMLQSCMQCYCSSVILLDY